MQEERLKKKMGKITSITSQKRKGRVNINIDSEYAFAVFESALVDFDLHKGKELLTNEIKKIKDNDDMSKCLEGAYRHLSYRPRSEKEIRDKLNKKYSRELTGKVIEKLKKQKYIDDEEFTISWIENRKYSRGPRALQNELIKKGISKETITIALENQNSDEIYNNAITLIRSKSKYKNLTKNDAYKKVAPYLQRRGYNYDIIKQIINELY